MYNNITSSIAGGPRHEKRVVAIRFHDAVLREGVLPLDLLNEQINQYVSEAASR